MHKQPSRWMLWALMFVACGMTQCKHSDSATKQTSNKPTMRRAVKAVSTVLGGCIRGQLLDEENRPVSYAEVSTKPPTSSRTANKKGIFEICFKRVQSSKSTRSLRVRIDNGKYQLVAVKDNKKNTPKTFVYSGKELELGKITMFARKFKLMEAKEKTGKTPESKAGGIIGSKPKGE